jgi:hypothetical protein
VIVCSSTARGPGPCRARFGSRLGEDAEVNLAAPVRTPGFPAASAVGALVRLALRAATMSLEGRRVDLRFAGRPVRLTVQSVAVSPTIRGLSGGRLGQVCIAAADVEWESVRFERLEVTVHNLRVQPLPRGGSRAGLQAGPVELSLTLGQDGLDALLQRGLRHVRLRTGPGEAAQAALAARPGWGCVELTPAVSRGALSLRPRAVVLPSGRRLQWPARLLPRLLVQADVLLPGSRLVVARVSEGCLELTAVIDRWPEPVDADS